MISMDFRGHRFQVHAAAIVVDGDCARLADIDLRPAACAQALRRPVHVVARIVQND